MKVTHLTSVHSRYDTRIFKKQCISLSKKYEVSLVVADGKGNERVNGITIYDVGKTNNKLKRVFLSTIAIFRIAKVLDQDSYHIHDPELIWVGYFLKSLYSKNVIFDSHEDVPRDIKEKKWINKHIRNLMAFFYVFFEKILLRKYSAIITSTDFILERMLKINKNSFSIKNFPILENSRVIDSEKFNDELVFCYVGSISVQRGIFEMLELVSRLNFKLHLAGSFTDERTMKTAKEHKGWGNVVYHGYVNKAEMEVIYSECTCGLLLLHEIETFRTSLPVKLFEYMEFGLPILSCGANDYNLLIKDAECGVVSDVSVEAIINEAINLNADKSALKKMSANGLNHVLKFSWKTEEFKLMNIYGDF